MTSGIYFMPEANQIVIAWEIFQKDECKIENTNLTQEQWNFGVRLETYQPCGVAFEGPNGSALCSLEWFEKYFIFIGEF